MPGERGGPLLVPKNGRLCRDWDRHVRRARKEAGSSLQWRWNARASGFYSVRCRVDGARFVPSYLKGRDALHLHASAWAGGARAL
jgi:hypothetical protein